VPELQRLRADHAPAVLAFELANRAYFAAFINDRGDEFYDQFTERHNAMLAEQEAGICIFHVLVGDDGTVLGRFNLYDLEDGTAVVGYRVAQQVAGRGVATASVRELCQLSADAVRPAQAPGGDLPRERRIPEGAGQGWVRPDWPGRCRRPRGHLV
jgi:[ribosomal protein S5]-alanine N-acetyltransferase